MTAAAPPRGGTRTLTLDAAGVPLSGLLSAPPGGTPRATVLALHGGGMTAGYFDARAHPGQSLLTLGARLGYTVLAPDRPGYGASAAHLPQGQTLAEQSARIRAALTHYAATHPLGAGLFVLGHSYGGKLALTCAADGFTVPLLGLDISGLGHRLAVPATELPSAQGQGHWRHNWGALRLYPPDTFRTCPDIVAPMPARERAEVQAWPARFAGVAARVRVPVRFTFAEYEKWWRHDEHALTELAGLLPAAPRVLVERQPQAGHNISLGWTAHTYHLRALAFLEECLAGHAVAGTTLPAAA
ncbi:alpha/beta fold hydrolase [Streptomyces sp. NBC_00564]|uniref:alpha/beta hydrolase n=1 Tax=unclassified Streptomyces TaxID=2593676 RepID=UPI002FCD732E|nr:alpha/beta fold hydrolase [Streptomyces sp. NBC_00564]WUC55525.1 alpha/beta fold hydrolase [Streptomyces sp. NBC_00554]